MNTNYNCGRCGTVNHFAHYERAKWHQATGIRCKRCGAVHSVVQGEVSVISRPMLPMGSIGVQSAWMLPWTRPVTPGYYECKFYDVTGNPLILWWTGHYFTTNEAQPTQRVQMRTFKTWRGVWG